MGIRRTSTPHAEKKYLNETYKCVIKLFFGKNN